MKFHHTLIALTVLALPSLSFATMNEMKRFKEAHPEMKDAKCIQCHIVMGKKDLNDYGKKYKEAGKDFSKMK